MRSEPLLATPPPAPVGSIGELYAIAMTQTQQASKRYGELAAKRDETFEPVRCVFEVLSEREAERAESINEASIAAIGRSPDQGDLRWVPIDLVPAEELSDVRNSLLSTAYGAWALAVRHRERAFIFWTYIAAVAESPAVREAAENMAREALRDGNLLRRERRLAWRVERSKLQSSDSPDSSEISSAPPSLRDDLLSLIGSNPSAPIFPDNDIASPSSGTLEEVKQRALRRAEQLSSIYLDEADSAVDQPRLELAELAARSIVRLADLRAMAFAPGLPGG